MNKFKMRFWNVQLMLLFLLMASCYYDKESELYPVNAVPCDTSNITYTGYIKAFLDSKCATPGCHQSGQQSPDLSTFASASANAANVYNAASGSAHSSRFSWTACEKEQLRVWCNNPVN